MIRIEAQNGAGLPAFISRENWGELMTDVDLWRSAIKDICAAVGMEMSAGPVAGYPGSCAVFVVGEQAVIKLFPPIFASDFKVERAVYELLDDRVSAVPFLIVEGVYRDRIDWPFLVFQFCSGEPIRAIYDQLAPDEKIQIAQQVGVELQTVYQTAVVLTEPFTPWPDFLLHRYHDCLLELRKESPLPGHLITEIESFLAQMVSELSQERAHLLNADLTDDHVLLSHQDGRWRLQAIIDWADAQIGPAAYEWVAAWFGLCRMDAAMFLALVATCTPRQEFDEAFRLQLLACTFLHRFGPLIIRERWQADPPLDKLSLKTLGQWLWPGIYE
jgi:hygromycin-B 7''-O-kinase